MQNNRFSNMGCLLHHCYYYCSLHHNGLLDRYKTSKCCVSKDVYGIIIALKASVNTHVRVQTSCLCTLIPVPDSRSTYSNSILFINICPINLNKSLHQDDNKLDIFRKFKISKNSETQENRLSNMNSIKDFNG